MQITDTARPPPRVTSDAVEHVAAAAHRLHTRRGSVAGREGGRSCGKRGRKELREEREEGVAGRERGRSCGKRERKELLASTREDSRRRGSGAGDSVWKIMGEARARREREALVVRGGRRVCEF